MIISTNIQELYQAKHAINQLKSENPISYQKFIHAIQLTRQLQYGFQYMGCLLNGDDPSNFSPTDQDSYVLTIYEQEINKLKYDRDFDAVKRLLESHKHVSYDYICKLILGEQPEMLAGPAVVR
ncbi:hypothetical protein [Gracilibacillus sp. YIM 98692]|uniref:hypothetical protein n=1 Tax=Gracilibacillus sp. YIM 98692 TaxID=2663532 RepID=UPI0013D07C4E|nr:hypothetical protein [Gracilibacillus sp. YIM 98692]